MFDTLPLAATATQTTFSWTNLIIVAILAAVLYPLISRMRASLTRSRKERWAREEQGDAEGDTKADDDGDRGRPAP